MAKSFLPTIFEHPYEIDPKYGKSVAYFSMEYAIDNSFKIYSGRPGLPVRLPHAAAPMTCARTS